ncbi:pyrophosphatase PpaX [Paenibacillus shirakamiensis]|uniref:Pyrophosphatase PpaX n=1 Tax=Paenibacillus shirakamiensis TaxID=1265935 RepID=A0ABS4JLC9_9BACL|nr:pyrophosphatase PpaX [Paenibacillus shirakamiensis]MBP2001404.1 pyrophosphatase PpaX [Paenibacillus shirakamiensis]
MIDTILFDLDGTIIDTNELIISSFQHILQPHVQQPFTKEQIIPHMGMTLQQQLQQFSGRSDVEDLVTEYRSYSSSRHDDMVQPFPHVEEVMATLYQKGYTLGVVTTKMKASSLMVLEMFGLLKYLKEVVTLDDVNHPKPHPEPVLTAVQRLGVKASTTLMIGDSPADLQSARAAGVQSAAVAWSLKGADVLKKYEPNYILSDMKDLYHVLGLEIEAK